MPRRGKWRKICCLSESNQYGPLNGAGESEADVVMSVDEYESIRLIDLENFSQEKRADQMNIARTTVQRIYEGARRSLAKSLVHGRIRRIEGGEYQLCDGL